MATIPRFIVMGASRLALAALIAGLASAPVLPQPPQPQSLWSHDNLFAWTVAPFDAKPRTPDERVEMLSRLGFTKYAYSWRPDDIPTFDAEIRAVKRNGIALIGWQMLLSEIDDAPAKASLEALKRHDMHPRIWVMQSLRGLPRTAEDWAELLPAGVKFPMNSGDFRLLSDSDKAAIHAALSKLRARDLPQSAEEQELRVMREADRIRHIVDVAARYGCKVALYNHGGWFGMPENQLAIIARLREVGVDDVGMVYNFSHARDEMHDDSKNFQALWAKMMPYVIAVNISGMRWEGDIVYPSQGDSELEMMRVIENSGWHGPVGLIAEKGGDAEITLRNYMIGLDWLAARLRQPDMGGKPVFLEQNQAQAKDHSP